MESISRVDITAFSSVLVGHPVLLFQFFKS
jgi:hypothetical protein